jgi:hypothetical protein
MKTKEITTFRKSYKHYDKQCYFEGLKLAVTFDEKDAVKKWGARWNADGGFWWMPADQLTVDVHAGIGTVKDWLNDNKMIMGQYGKFNENEYTRNMFTGGENYSYTEYTLFPPNNEPQYKVQFFYDHDVAKFIPTRMGESASEYYTVEDGRKRWNVFIGIGYNRIENS